MTPGSTGDKETMVGGGRTQRVRGCEQNNIPRDGKLPAKGLNGQSSERQ